MSMRTKNSGVWMAVLLCVPVMMLCGQPLRAQTPAAAADAKSEPLDTIVAIVNQDVILESDVQEEMRFSAFEPYRMQTAGTPRDQALERLINRTLIRSSARC